MTFFRVIGGAVYQRANLVKTPIWQFSNVYNIALR